MDIILRIIGVLIWIGAFSKLWDADTITGADYFFITCFMMAGLLFMVIPNAIKSDIKENQNLGIIKNNEIIAKSDTIKMEKDNNKYYIIYNINIPKPTVDTVIQYIYK